MKIPIPKPIKRRIILAKIRNRRSGDIRDLTRRSILAHNARKAALQNPSQRALLLAAGHFKSLKRSYLALVKTAREIGDAESIRKWTIQINKYNEVVKDLEGRKADLERREQIRRQDELVKDWLRRKSPRGKNQA